METRSHARSIPKSGLQATPLAPSSQAGSSGLATTPRRRLLPPTPEPYRPPNFPPPAPLKVRGSLAQSWRDWRQQWNAYLTVMRLHDQQDDYLVALFLSCIGPVGTRIYNGLPFANEDDKQTLRCVLRLFDEKCIGEINPIYERYVFTCRNQTPDEDFEQFLTDIRQLIDRCDYGALTDDLLRDRIVHGIRDEPLRQRLLSKKDLTLEKCILICRSYQNTARQMSVMRQAGGDSHKTPDDESLHAFQHGRTHKGKPKAQRKAADTASECRNCGGSHDRGKCSAFGKTCGHCGKANHYTRVCRSKQRGEPAVRQMCEDTVATLSDSDDEEVIMHLTLESSDDESVATVNAMRDVDDKFPKKLETILDVNGRQVRFQLDTGAGCNTIRECDLPEDARIARTNKVLRLYDKSTVPPAGECEFRVRYINGKRWYRGKFLVVRDAPVSILGSSASIQMGFLKVRPQFLHAVTATEQVKPGTPVSLSKEDLLRKYPAVFEDKLGTFPGEETLELDPSVQPVKLPTRRPPIALKERFRAELQRLEKQGVISPVTRPTDWVSAPVIIPKPNGSIRLCLDPKPLNRALKRSHYHMPTLEDILPELDTPKVFSVADVRNGFWHVLLDAFSRSLTTFGTPFGRYQWNRLPFGIAPAPEIFQRRLLQCLEGLTGVYVVADDILIVGDGPTESAATADHDRKLVQLLERCAQLHIQLNLDKLQLRVSSVAYLGHLLTTAGLKPHPKKVAAVADMPPPTDVHGVRRILGVVNYLSRFVPHLALCDPLRKLTHQDASWQWTEGEQAAFERIKTAISSEPVVLRFYKPTEKLTLQCDASDVGMGAALLQNGQPLAYASAAFTSTQRAYAQIEKELLAIVFGLEHFHQYTFGRVVHVESDHKPLEAISRKPLHSAPRRLQRMLLRLHNYDTVIEYRKGADLHIADTLSRAYLASVTHTEEFVSFMDELAHTTSGHDVNLSRPALCDIRRHTQDDDSLQALIRVLRSGWPDSKRSLPVTLTPYFAVRDQLVEQDGIIYKGQCVLIPEKMRTATLQKLHASHIGINGCVRRATDVLYWPGLTSHLKATLQQCDICRSYDLRQSKESFISHAVPNRPWAKVGADLFQFRGKEYLVLSDYFSNYVEVEKLPTTDSAAVVRALKRQWARHGIPDLLVSDNGPQFSSSTFRTFAAAWGFLHVTSSPGYPQSNGKAENAVRTVKRLWRKAEEAGEDKWLALLDWLNTPSEHTRSSPAQRFYSRRTRTLLPTAPVLLTPNVPSSANSDLTASKAKQASYYDTSAKDLPALSVGDSVFVQPVPHDSSAPWKPAKIVTCLPHRSYVVEMRSGNRLRRNRRHLRLATNRKATPTVSPSSRPTSSSTRPSSLRSASPSSSHPQPSRGRHTRSGRPTRAPAYLQEYVT